MLFRLSDVQKSYGAQEVLRGASLQVNPGEHFGLVGRNGAGKTTLFRLVTGEESADRGDVVRARGLRLGLLEQHVDFEPGTTVHEAALAAFGQLQSIEHEMHQLEHRMAEAPEDLDAVLARYSDLQHEIENGRAVSYNGNYSAFLVEREERREAQMRAYENQQQLIAKTEEFIRRNLAGQKTKQAKSRRKMLEKLERVDAVRPDQSSGNFQLQKVERAGTHVLTVEDAAIGYPGKLLAADITFILRRGECLGVIGPNGSGKTTFLKTVLGKLPQLAGEIRWGANVSVGYYAQQLDDLDERNEVIMELRRVAPPSVTAGELRGFLARFLFTGDDVYKHVRDLSGGEKGRLALAKLIYSRVNVLVLDEPTNHLDIPSREALEEALDAYDGTIITISHDRYFLDRVATQILALDGAGGAEHYDGDYTEYHDWKAARRAAESAARAEREKASASRTEPRAESGAPRDASKSKGGGGSKKKKGSGRGQRAVEDEIAEVERSLAAVGEEMSTPDAARDPRRLARPNEDYKKAEARLQRLYAEWERVVADAADACSH